MKELTSKEIGAVEGGAVTAAVVLIAVVGTGITSYFGYLTTVSNNQCKIKITELDNQRTTETARWKCYTVIVGAVGTLISATVTVVGIVYGVKKSKID